MYQLLNLANICVPSPSTSFLLDPYKLNFLLNNLKASFSQHDTSPLNILACISQNWNKVFVNNYNTIIISKKMNNTLIYSNMQYIFKFP